MMSDKYDLVIDEYIDYLPLDILEKINQCLGSFRRKSVEFSEAELEYIKKAVATKVDTEVGRVSPLAVPEDDCTVELATENAKLREDIRVLKTKVAELEYAGKALEIIGVVGCENLHHKRSQYHMAGEPCPVEQRLHDLLK